MSGGYNPFSDPAMLELFKQEVDAHSKTLTSGLLDLEKSAADSEAAEKMMRAAHSIKGAARMVGIDVVVKVAHAMEDCFVAAQKGQITLDGDSVDVLLQGIDTINDISTGSTDAISEEQISSLTGKLEQIEMGTFTSLEAPASSQEQPSQADSSMLSLFRDDAKKTLKHVYELFQECPDNELDTNSLDKTKSYLQTLRSGAKLSSAQQIFTLVETLEKIISLHDSSGVGVPLQNDEVFSNTLVLLEDTVNTLPDIKKQSEFDDLLAIINKSIESLENSPSSSTEQDVDENDNRQQPSKEERAAQYEATVRENQDTIDHSIQISTQRLNRLVGLAGESVVESKWVRSHSDSMQIYKRRQTDIINALDKLRNHLDEAGVAEHITELFGDIQKRANNARSFLGSRLTELDDYDRRLTSLSERLNHQVLQTRMRPFSDATHGFERMIRDLARSLGKRVELKIKGDNTQVDREILARIEAPLNHILRNAVDHGIETTDERIAVGKPESASIVVEAAHNMGMLSITIKDDGQGVNMDSLRQRIIERDLASEEMVASLNDNELLDFLYLPGFSTRSDVTEISGRGVGLDVVHSTIQEMRGQIRTTSTQGKGIRIQLLLPLTLSVIRSLLVNISDQAYALPLARIDSIHTLRRSEIQTMEGKQYFTINDRHIGLISAAQILEVSINNTQSDDVNVIVLGDRNSHYAIVVDEFVGERDLAVHVLDPRLGKIRDISAATLLENGEPALIIDIEDMIRSIEILISGERLAKINRQIDTSESTANKRILVVDDSITVREVERKLLESRGYLVDLAVDGMDGWNTVHNEDYDLIISDIDMPRMNGIEFVTMLKGDTKFRQIPVMIVSYKDRKEDRDAGLQAGADYYLTKGSFHDESLIEAVEDLIGKAE